MPILRVTNTQKYMYTRTHTHTQTRTHTRALGSKTIFNLNWATAVFAAPENCDAVVVVDVIIVVNVALLLSKPQKAPSIDCVNTLCELTSTELPAALLQLTLKNSCFAAHFTYF